MKKFIAILASCAAVTTLGAPAFANPPGTPTATDNMAFYGDIAKECSLIDASTFTDDGAVAPTPGNQNDAVAYTPVAFNSFGAIGEAPNPEDRTAVLQASDTSVFDCNTDTVAVSITVANLITPTNTNATNIDNVTHLVEFNTVHLGNISTNPGPIGSFFSNALPTDSDGDISVQLVSRMLAQNEELTAGSYLATFNITVTAQ